MYVDDANGGAPRRTRADADFGTREEAIELINYDGMVDRIYEHVYGRVIERDVRRPQMWIVPSQAKNQQHPTATPLTKMVSQANNCSDPVARGHTKRSVDLDMISSEKDGTTVYYFMDTDQRVKLKLMLELRAIARKVVDAQLADPTNPRAGIELFPENVREAVYFNVVVQIQIKEK